MYRFNTKDGQCARIEPNAVRAIIPSGLRTGYIKLVLDGGHAITVEGDTDGMYNILSQYRLHPVSAHVPADERSEAERLLPQAVSDAMAAKDELRIAMNHLRDTIAEAESAVPPHVT